MTSGKFLSVALSALVLCACRANSPDVAPATPNAKSAPSAVAGTVTSSDSKDSHNMPDTAQPATQVAPPTPSSVLYFIYQVDGDGATSYDVGNGSVATYWYGYPFDLDGKHYFTGFAYQTPEKFGKDKEDTNPAPDTKVTITEATYVQTSDGKKPWLFQGATNFVGEFGGFEKGNEVDQARQPQTFKTSGGKLLLAVPTWYLASGTRVSSYEIFVFNPHELTKIDETRWTYLGNVPAGDDNGAACDEDDGGKLPCARSVGSLSFVASSSGELPTIHVALTGTEVAAPGKTRQLGAADAIDYHFDAAEKQYLK